jgi:hypothetical protein
MSQKKATPQVLEEDDEFEEFEEGKLFICTIATRISRLSAFNS